jgi:ribosomal protein L37E
MVEGTKLLFLLHSICELRTQVLQSFRVKNGKCFLCGYFTKNAMRNSGKLKVTKLKKILKEAAL